MSGSDRAINAKHCINVIGYSAGIYTSIGRSGDIRGIETLIMLHSQRHAALAIAATAQVRFVPQTVSLVISKFCMRGERPLSGLRPQKFGPRLRVRSGPSLLAQLCPGVRYAASDLTTARSPTCEFEFFAASACSVKIAASARFMAPHGGVDRCHSFTTQRIYRRQRSSRGTNPTCADAAIADTAFARNHSNDFIAVQHWSPNLAFKRVNRAGRLTDFSGSLSGSQPTATRKTSSTHNGPFITNFQSPAQVVSEAPLFRSTFGSAPTGRASIWKYFQRNPAASKM